jgi:hypothetical protein
VQVHERPQEIRRPVIRPATLVRAVIPAAALLAVALYARYALAITYHPYDDEGYVLLTLDHYLKGGGLYTDVFSQYGPFFFYFQEALFRLLHLPVSHDAGRLVALICWLSSAACGGYFVAKVSNSSLLAAAAILACGIIGSPLAAEPGHPQQVVLLLLMAACCISLAEAGSWLGPLLLGALGAALLFTKINVGVFYFAALACALVCSLPVGRLRTFGGLLLLVYAVGGPVVLMHNDFLAWARGYCAISILCLTTTFAAALLTRSKAPHAGWSLVYMGCGASAAAALIVLGGAYRGMTLATLADGVLWAPLRQPKVFSIPLWIGRFEVACAILTSAAVAFLIWARMRWERSWAVPADALRCVAGLYAITSLTFSTASLPWVVPVLPLGLLPLRDRTWAPSELFPRLFVTALAASQFLQAYPVAGSQLHIANAPVILWAFICIYDGMSGLGALMRIRTTALEPVLGALAAAVVLAAMFHSGSLSWNKPNPPSRLRGSGILHLPPEIESRYLFLANSIGKNCDVLFGLPQLGSLNFWSGVRTPNGSNLDAWMTGFSSAKQEEILRLLQADPQSCAVYNPKLTQFWGVTADQLAHEPLAQFIIRDMRPVANRDGYEIRVHPNRTVPWIGQDNR